MVICLERDADLHMAQLMPLPLTISCFSKIQIGFTFLVPAHPGGPGKRAVKRVCVCVCHFFVCWFTFSSLSRGLVFPIPGFWTEDFVVPGLRDLAENRGFTAIKHIHCKSKKQDT